MPYIKSPKDEYLVFCGSIYDKTSERNVVSGNYSRQGFFLKFKCPRKAMRNRLLLQKEYPVTAIGKRAAMRKFKLGLTVKEYVALIEKLQFSDI